MISINKVDLTKLYSCISIITKIIQFSSNITGKKRLTSQSLERFAIEFSSQNAAPLYYFLNSPHYAIAAICAQFREIARNSPTTMAVSRLIMRLLSLLFCVSCHGTVTVTKFNFCDRRQLPRDAISDPRRK